MTIEIDQLIDLIPSDMTGLFNPWLESCASDDPENTIASKRDRLRHHLSGDTRLILCGEAPGYQGCRYSGIPFTSERLLLEGAIPRVSHVSGRLTNRARPFSEPSATIVWRVLYSLGLAEHTVLWNALQCHPFKPGQPWSNRTPRPEELALGEPAMRMLVDIFPDAKLVAVGRKAELLLDQMNVRPEAAVRHPANGGARKFEEGLSAVSGDLSHARKG